MEEDREFLYVALERCRTSLSDPKVSGMHKSQLVITQNFVTKY